MISYNILEYKLSSIFYIHMFYYKIYGCDKIKGSEIINAECRNIYYKYRCDLSLKKQGIGLTIINKNE